MEEDTFTRCATDPNAENNNAFWRNPSLRIAQESDVYKTQQNAPKAAYRLKCWANSFRGGPTQI